MQPETLLMMMCLNTIETLNFDNTALKELPLDPETKNYVRREVKNACFSLADPTPVINPTLVAYSEEALELLGLDVSEAKRSDFAEYFSGNKQIPGTKSAAHCYCGFQFGSFAGQLGDGRAMYLGETINQKGERWELQFKGAGKTPYSRDGDGRAVLRSSIREFLCSEAMHHLGVPTTRAGTLVTSDSYAVRDIFYNGNPIRERVTIVSRIAPTFLRFGSFQIANPRDRLSGRAGPSSGNLKIIKQLLDYVIKYHFKEIHEKFSEEDYEARTEAFFKEVIRSTAQMVAMWQSVGFAHGVMNTDNMSILGLTIDYGPFGFLDTYNPDFIPNHSDSEGRYSFKNQPSICKWNLRKFGESISGFFAHSSRILESIDTEFDSAYDQFFYDKMRKKLGLFTVLPEDKSVIDAFLSTMSETGADMTNTFRNLSKFPISGGESEKNSMADLMTSQCEDARSNLKRKAPKIRTVELEMFQRLSRENPEVLEMLGTSIEYIEEELRKAQEFTNLRNITNEEKSENDKGKWLEWLNLYEQRLSKELEGISEKTQIEEKNQERVRLMNTNNPKFVLRNHLAQDAIEKAEKGDYSDVHNLYAVLRTPYDEHEEMAHKRFNFPEPEKAAKCVVSCSS